MKKIKIRYVKHADGIFTMQRMTIFGWKNVTFDVGGLGGVVVYRYGAKSKKKVLKKVLKSYYKVHKNFITIIEYPKIRIY